MLPHIGGEEYIEKREETRSVAPLRAAPRLRHIGYEEIAAMK